ncbi:LysM peptidoglycan-binding domain-containing protein [Nocardioides sp.]|uniref:LysM peptidoglycan-binding domain-containing protein n=1 Tax=Nocardioides sp. TaxID=35761 RepID=UPI003565761C
MVGGGSRTRAAAVTVLATLLGVLAGRVLVVGLAPARTAEDGVVLLSTAALGIALMWAWACAVAVSVEIWQDQVGSTSWVPSGLRRAVLALCGAAMIGTASLSPALAAGEASPPTHAEVRSVPNLTGLPLPDRASGGLVASAPVRQAAGTPARLALVVRAGDCLWDIASAHLPTDSSAAEVASYVQAIHELNRDTIGPRVDLIRPGQRLLLPDRPATAHRAPHQPAPSSWRKDPS